MNATVNTAARRPAQPVKRCGAALSGHVRRVWLLLPMPGLRHRAERAPAKPAAVA